MMIRAIDSNGDFCWGKGKNDYKSGIDAIKQNLLTRLLSWKNDCFFDKEAGVDYTNFLDIGTKDFLDRDVKRVILQSEGVMKINTFSSEIDDRDYYFQCSIVTIYGNLEVNNNA